MKDINKLKRRKDFAYTYKKGLSRSANGLVLVYCPVKESVTRIGFSVPSKFGKAVVRNHTKRQLREVLTALLPKIKDNHNLVFVVKSGLTTDYGQLTVAVEKLLASADLLV